MEQQIYRALVVDDEPLIREGVSRTMAQHSFCCDVAADGAEAISKLHRSNYDLIITDLRMPRKHGHALVLEVLETSTPPQIVVLTGVADHRLVRDLLSRGVSDVVHKPVDFHVFATKMLSIFERRQWSDSLSETNNSVAVSSRRKLIEKTEEAVELFSECVPESLKQALAGAFCSSPPLPDGVAAMVKRLSGKKIQPHEQRQKMRFSLVTNAVAIPVNKDFQPQGDPVTLTFSNLSETGACLFHTRSIPHEYLAIRWKSVISNSYLQAVLHLRRSEPIGPYYEIAGEFVMHD